MNSISWFPDFLAPKVISRCCARKHDKKYIRGGSHAQRVKADQDMKRCLARHSQQKNLSKGVRLYCKIASPIVYIMLRAGGSFDRLTHLPLFGKFNYRS